QELVREHVAEHARRDRLQEVEGEESLLDRDGAEEQSERGEREGDRIADQHEQHEAAEHERRHPLDRDHCSGLSYLASTLARPSIAAMRLMISETPCRASSTKPAGSTNLIGQRNSSTAVPAITPRAYVISLR